MTEEQPAAAHVAASDELAREDEPSPERLEQDVDVLARCDAAKEDDARRLPNGGGQCGDVAAEGTQVSLAGQTLDERRDALESFMKTAAPKGARVRLSPATTSMATVTKWFRSVGGGLDGVVAKRLDVPYQSGNRDGMQKMKHQRTAECVVGGFRYASKGKVVGSLLLGLYDAGGLLHHVGFTSNIPAEEKKPLTAKLEKLVKAPGFTGQAPGGPSRWSTARTSEWQPLAPKLVVEVKYDHFSGGRFRHGTSFMRWRPDKAPKQCTIAQLEQEGRSAMNLLR